MSEQPPTPPLPQVPPPLPPPGGLPAPQVPPPLPPPGGLPAPTQPNFAQPGLEQLPPPGSFAATPPPGPQFGPQNQAASYAPASSDNNGVATTAMVLGIIALVTFWLCGLGALLGILAAVLGFVGLSKSKKSAESKGRGQAIAGIVTGLLALIVTVGLFMVFFAFGTFGPNNFPDSQCDQSRYWQDPDC